MQAAGLTSSALLHVRWALEAQLCQRCTTATMIFGRAMKCKFHRLHVRLAPKKSDALDYLLKLHCVTLTKQSTRKRSARGAVKILLKFTHWPIPIKKCVFAQLQRLSKKNSYEKCWEQTKDIQIQLPNPQIYITKLIFTVKIGVECIWSCSLIPRIHISI